MVLGFLFLLLVSGYSDNCPKDGKNYKYKGHKINMDFKTIDTNSDNALSLEEYKAAFPSSQKKGFDFLDTDKNNRLDPAEWEKFVEMHKGMESYHHKKTT